MSKETKNNDGVTSILPLGNEEAIKVGIIGGAGYTGGELIRILLNHPNAVISFVHSKSNAGNLIASVHEDLIGETKLKFSGDEALTFTEDVLFLCAGHGEAKKFLAQHNIPNTVKIIDIGNDFRLKKDSTPSEDRGSFIYGLPELQREEIKQANNIANPGCFATAIQLGLLPLAKAGLLKEVYTTGITGSTGAGQSLSATSHFSWRANNIQAYKTLTHQHLGEIHQSLNEMNTSTLEDAGIVNFVPWRGDFTRGIFISSTITCNLSLDELYQLFESFYENHPFTFVTKKAIGLKQVVNTNKCLIQLEKEGNKLVIHSVIDNLLKGASGQAVQNMNLMFGFDEKAGLNLKGIGF